MPVASAELHITNFPSVRRVRTQGVSSSVKTISFPGKDEGVKLQVGEETLLELSGTADLTKAVRVLTTLLLAVMTKAVNSTAYGGGTEGYISTPGGGTMRVFMTRAAEERLTWAITDYFSQLSNLEERSNFADNVFAEFMRVLATRRVHPDTIIDTIVDRRLNDLRPATATTGTRSAEPTAAEKPRSTDDASDGRNRAWCPAHLTSTRGCSNDACPYLHPPNMLGVAVGQGAKRRASGGGGGNAQWHVGPHSTELRRVGTRSAAPPAVAEPTVSFSDALAAIERGASVLPIDNVLAGCAMQVCVGGRAVAVCFGLG